MPIATDSWALELWAEDGLSRDDIRVDVDEQYDTVPGAFRDAVDETYYDSLVDTAQDVLDDGDTPILAYDGDGRAVAVADGALVYEDSGEAVGTDWDDRPTLYAEHDVDDREKVFWDGATVVSTPRIAEDGVVLESYEGSYAERLAAQDAVDEYPVDDLPLSTNITVVPVVERGGEEVIPVFYRNEQVAEYPNFYHTVAGGIPDVEMHPVDAGWMESVEEIRIGPDWDADTYADRGVVDAETAARMRRGTVEDHDIVTVPADGQRNVYRADGEMAVTGLVRNLETHTPELCAVVETGVDYDLVAENYTRAAEHADIEPLPVDGDAVTDFVTERDNVIPVGAAAFLLAAEHLTGERVVAEVAEEQELPAPYATLETVRV